MVETILDLDYGFYYLSTWSYSKLSDDSVAAELDQASNVSAKSPKMESYDGELLYFAIFARTLFALSIIFNQADKKMLNC